MSPRQWVRVCLEWALLGFGLACLGTYTYATVEAHRFQQQQAAAFERGAASGRLARPGQLLGMLDIPRLALSTVVIEGDDDGTLEKAVGHLPDTPLPWLEGNSAIAGHRDGLFGPLKDVKIGDEIRFRTREKSWRYRVTRTRIVDPDDLSVLEKRSRPSLTLITCYPFRYVGTAPQRFIVHAERLPSS